MKRVEITAKTLEWAWKCCEKREERGPEGNPYAHESHTFEEGCAACVFALQEADPQAVLEEITMRNEPAGWRRVLVSQEGGCNTCGARPKYVWMNDGKRQMVVRMCDACIKALKQAIKP